VEAPWTPVDELECAVCGSQGRRGFRAEYGAGDDEEPERELIVFCGTCWKREFDVTT
jgi:hypothetical protein